MSATGSNAGRRALARVRFPNSRGIISAHFEVFETFVAVDVEDERGTTIRVFDLPACHEIALPRPAESASPRVSSSNDNEANLDPAATVLRFRFTGPLQPQCIYDFDSTTGALTLRKEDAASRWFDPRALCARQHQRDRARR